MTEFGATKLTADLLLFIIIMVAAMVCVCVCMCVRKVCVTI